MTEEIRIEIADRVLSITIDRPRRRNALTQAMYNAMTASLDAARTDTEIRAVLLRGAGGNFTSGNDIADFMNVPPTGESSPVFRFLEEIATFPKPIVAAVEGHAVGIGLTALLHCDLVYVAETASLQVPFTKLGVVPEAGSSYLLPRLMGHARAAELLLLSEPITGTRAAELGLATRAVPVDSLYHTAAAAAQRLASLPPASIRESKRLMKKTYSGAMQEAMMTEAGVFVERLGSAEATEAFTAFFEKREPDFSSFE
jgi:enoyl-CoA hydratase/carnithine racemase